MNYSNLVVTLFLLLVISFSSNGQLKPGFEEKEAIDLIRICNSQTFLDIYDSDSKIIPEGYERIYSSTPNVMDNMFQVYKKGRIGVIHFRGSTAHPNSWIENVHSAMIPAKDTINIYSQKNDYCFAENPEAAVHSGFALGVVILIKEVISQIKLLNSEGIYNIIITGHSQGGALATMSYAYLRNMKKETISKRNTFKCYAFANPMCGNKAFASEYNHRFTGEGWSFRIINPKDIIPSMPLSYHDEKLISTDHIISWLKGDEEFDPKKLGIEVIMRKFKVGISAYINKSNQLIEKLISKQTGGISTPNYVNDIQYISVGEQYEIGPFEYPEIIKDSIDINPKEFKDYKRLKNGQYQREEPTFFQHKPYNYYVGFAKKFLPNEYEKIQKKYLEEHL